MELHQATNETFEKLYSVLEDDEDTDLHKRRWVLIEKQTFTSCSFLIFELKLSVSRIVCFLLFLDLDRLHVLNEQSCPLSFAKVKVTVLILFNGDMVIFSYHSLR